MAIGMEHEIPMMAALTRKPFKAGIWEGETCGAGYIVRRSHEPVMLWDPKVGWLTQRGHEFIIKPSLVTGRLGILLAVGRLERSCQ